jgi:hypothetical protein
MNVFIHAAVGDLQSAYIKARPATLNAGPYHPNNNPFKVLQNVSLNLAKKTTASCN